MEFSAQFGIDSGAFSVTLICLFVFGLAFNQIIDWMHKRGLNEGYTWLEVVLGTAVTVIASGFTLGWSVVVVMFAYFAASGLFMAGGDIWRHMKARENENFWRLGRKPHVSDLVDDVELEE